MVPVSLLAAGWAKPAYIKWNKTDRHNRIRTTLIFVQGISARIATITERRKKSPFGNKSTFVEFSFYGFT
jgi:hypothetical protein